MQRGGRGAAHARLVLCVLLRGLWLGQATYYLLTVSVNRLPRLEDSRICIKRFWSCIQAVHGL